MKITISLYKSQISYYLCIKYARRTLVSWFGQSTCHLLTCLYPHRSRMCGLDSVRHKSFSVGDLGETEGAPLPAVLPTPSTISGEAVPPTVTIMSISRRDVLSCDELVVGSLIWKYPVDYRAGYILITCHSKFFFPENLISFGTSEWNIRSASS